MPDIVDPIAIRYLSEVLRPAADQLSRAMTLIDSVMTDRAPAARDLDALFPPGGGVVEDNRAAEGIAPVNCDQVQALLKAMATVQGMVDNDQDPATGQHTGVTTRMILHRFAVNPR